VSLPAVVIAAGVGNRLRPLTERYAKPLLPIDGRPVLATLLRDLAAASCPYVTLVTGHLAEQVEAFVGDGSAWRLSLTTVRQARPDGSADAVVTARATPPYLVVGADTVFAPGELARFGAVFEQCGAAGALAVRRKGREEPGRNGVAVEDGLVRGLRAAESPFAGAPLWAVGPAVAAVVETLPGSVPYELATAFQQAIDAGERVAAIEIGPTRDLTAPTDLLLENFPYLGAL
jgi:NDP-sugar pyrophosphorylase family protein